MTSLFLTGLRLVRATFAACAEPEFRALLSLMIIMLFSGTIFYVSNEGWSYIDALYFCVMTMSTVGYGDLVPTSSTSKIFTMVYAVVSIGVFVALASKLAQAMLTRSTRSRVRAK